MSSIAPITPAEASLVVLDILSVIVLETNLAIRRHWYCGYAKVPIQNIIDAVHSHIGKRINWEDYADQILPSYEAVGWKIEMDTIKQRLRFTAPFEN